MLSRRRLIGSLSAVLLSSHDELAFPFPDQEGGGHADEAASEAKSLMDKLLRGIEDSPREYAPRDLKIHTADIEAAVDRFGFQLRYCIRRDRPMWAAQLKGSAPVPLDWGVPFGPSWPEHNELIDAYIDSVFKTLSQLSEKAAYTLGFALKSVSPKESEENFAEALLAFLTVRFRSQKPARATLDHHRIGIGSVHIGLGKTPPPGFPFRVFTHLSGMRVHYTFAYFPSHNPPVFGAPTTPVDGWIQAGRWLFGVCGPTSPLTFDPGPFDVPDLSEAHLMI